MRKLHKKHARRRETVCGLEYDKREDWSDFVINQTVGHWDKVTCKNCIRDRKYYEKRINRKGGIKNETN